MDRQDVAYMINTTPKYFYLLHFHVAMLRRYAPSLKWPIYLVTEEPNHEKVVALKKAFPEINILPITPDKEAFFESRAEGTRLLPAEIQYVFPIQEDFILEARPMSEVLKEVVEILDENLSVSSVRLMPCPGPRGSDTFGDSEWIILDSSVDEYVFTYQATLWRREAYQEYMDALISKVEKEFGNSLTPQQKVQIQVKANVGECDFGQKLLTKLHLAWKRSGTQSNAVYLCAWPYRPTAVVQGKLEEWAIDLALREGVFL